MIIDITHDIEQTGRVSRWIERAEKVRPIILRFTFSTQFQPSDPEVQKILHGTDGCTDPIKA